MKEYLKDSLKLKSTKEKIIAASIHEFANKGYDNASIRKIAEIVGIRGSSIYNHFNSKEDILEEIFKYYRNSFYKEGVKFDIDGVCIKDDTIPNMLKQGVYSVTGLLKRPQMTNILKILMKEQFKNQKIKEFFLEEFINNPRVFMQEFLEELMRKGLIKEVNTYLLSQEFQAFAVYKMYEEFMLKDFDNIDIQGLDNEISEHIDFFWNSIRK